MIGKTVKTDLMLALLASGGAPCALSWPGKQGTKEGPFLDCLLGAFTGVCAVTGNDPSQDLAKSGYLSPVLTGIERKTDAAQWDLLASSTDVSEVSAMGKERTEGKSEACPGAWKAESASPLVTHGSPLLKVADNPLPAAPRKESQPRVESPRLTREGSVKEADTTLAKAVEKDLESPCEMFRVPKETPSVSSDLALPKDGKPLATQTPVPTLADHGKGDTRELLAETLHRLLGRSQTNPDGDPQMMRDDTGLHFTEASASQIHQKKDTRAFGPIHQETTTTPTNQYAPTGSAEIPRNRPLPVFLADSVVQQILENLNVKTWKLGPKQLRIQLQPEEMGRLSMQIGLKDHQVVLRIHVENPFVKDLIENSLAQLREGFLDQGLKLDRCSVSVGEQFQHPFEGRGDSSQGGGDASFSVDRGEREKTASEPLDASFYRDSDSINLFI
jgi:hypothetical protein